MVVVMPTSRPLECGVILPSRFSAVRPRTWNLVMDNAGRALAEHFGSHMSFNQTAEEASLRNRDRRMLRDEGFQDTYSAAKQGAGASNAVGESKGEQQEERVRTAAYSFISGRITAAGESETFGKKKQQEQKQHPISYDNIPREIPVSFFH
ncbi:hypothetical protein LSM04_004403 [Trypanosoma melophagium]|uniref:uncharacterized protein n=1 Tax=Trypanosoma melophagium TaxID=715481 RepID=UPI00351A1BD6|nr:hypothetical protein LSM04_004403 [Trypanosoma melophagium]